MPNLPFRPVLTTLFAICGLSLAIQAGPQNRPQTAPDEPGPAISGKMGPADRR